MAIFQATFKDLKFEQVEGFKISAAFTPKLGFEGNFFVYIWDRVDADKSFSTPVKVVDGNDDPIRDTLTLTDGAEVTYTFPKIDISYAEVGATRAQRYRLVEFRYHQDVTDRDDPAPINLRNINNKKLTYGRLKNDYDFNLDDSPESLFSYRARLSPKEINIVRYAALRNKDNSFLKKIIEVNKSQNNQKMESFMVNFKQGKTEVTQDNLVRAYVDESFGFFTTLDLPSLHRISDTHAESALSQIDPQDFNPMMLLNHDMKNFRKNYETSDTVETATLVFTAGTYRKLEIK